MEEVLICYKNLMLKSPLKVNRPLEFIEARNLTLPLGVDSYLKFDFYKGRVIKTLKFALKVMEGCRWHAKSSYPATPPPKKVLERAPVLLG